MRILLFSLLNLLLVEATLAQAEQASQPSILFKFDITNLMNPNDPAALFYLETRFSDHLASNFYGGPIVSSPYHADSQVDDPDYSGFKMGHEFRIYTPEFTSDGSLYWGLVTQYRFFSIYDRYTLGVNCFSGSCDYYRNFVGELKTDRFTYELRFGYQASLFDQVMFEFDYGVGFHDTRLRRSSVDGGKLVDGSRYLSEGDFDRLTFLSFSMKLGYVITQKKMREPSS